MKFFPSLIILFITQIVFCQTDSEENKAKISSVLEEYFDLNREAIHLHVNKTTFLTNESVWYQGYIVDRKSGKPFFTTNVFVALYDENGKKLSDKLIYASDGAFSGKIALNKAFHTGNYYIHIYTNWMNNFSENESTLQRITIVNPEEGAKNYKKVNPHTLELAVNPEGGNLILGIPNSVGIQIKDCRGNAPENCEAMLQTNSGEVLNTIKLNPFGYGQFDFTPLNNNYKVVVNYEGQAISKPLPNAEIIGFTLKVNNYSVAGKTLVNVKTNLSTAQNLSSKKVFLVVHQDQKNSINEIAIDEHSLEQTFTIPASALKSGINTIRIVDSDLKEYASRLIYIYPQLQKTISFTRKTLLTPGRSNRIQLFGISQYPNAKLSSAFLPEKSMAWDDSNNIYGGLTINPYLSENLAHANYYFNNPNRIQFYELDLVLLNQTKKKYDWEIMKVSKPNTNYNFDIGLDLKGQIDPATKNKTAYKAKFVSAKNLILKTTDIDEKGDYNFDHMIFPDSTFVEMSLLRLPEFEEVKSNLKPQVFNRKRSFNKEFMVKIPEYCDDGLETIDMDFIEYADKNIIKLDEVKIGEPRKMLKYATQLGNGQLRGFKIDANQETQTLLQFLRFNGFNVDETIGSVAIYSRQKNSLNATQTGPAIYIDNRQIMATAEIELMQMNEIDEIYLNPHAIVPSVKNYQGIIKIYRKRITDFSSEKGKASNGFYIADGFSKYDDFANANYDSVGGKAFNLLGLLNWSQRMQTDNEGTFAIEFPDYNNQKGRTIIEGMTNDGVLFQEEAVIDLK